MSILPLTLSGAEVRKRGRRIIGPVDLTIAPGGPTVILGPNGAGKTTLLRAMHGIDRLAQGGADWAVARGDAKYLRVLETHSKTVHTKPQRCDIGVVLFRNLAKGLSSKLSRTDAFLSIKPWE